MFQDDIVLKGKHAFYLKNLSGKNKETPSLYPFDRYIDTFLLAATIGIELDLKGIQDKTSEYKEEKANIFKSAIDTEYDNIEFLIYTIALRNISDENNKEELVKVFNEDKSILFNKYEKEFYSYTYGGLEKLREFFGEIDEVDRTLKENMDTQFNLIEVLNEERHKRNPDYSLENLVQD